MDILKLIQQSTKASQFQMRKSHFQKSSKDWKKRERCVTADCSAHYVPVGMGSTERAAGAGGNTVRSFRDGWWWLSLPLIPALKMGLRVQAQNSLQKKFQASQSYNVRPCLKKRRERGWGHYIHVRTVNVIWDVKGTSVVLYYFVSFYLKYPHRLSCLNTWPQLVMLYGNL